MYRDNSLMPKEAVRLAVLGEMLVRGPARYAEVAAAVRHFTGRIAGPSLDLMGTSLEMLRLEGVIAAVDGAGMEENALLAITPAGEREFATLMGASIRAPSADSLNKLILALKMRFLHLLLPEQQQLQVEELEALFETELARLEDLRRHHGSEPGWLGSWLNHDIAQIQDRLTWIRNLGRKV